MAAVKHLAWNKDKTGQLLVAASVALLVILVSMKISLDKQDAVLCDLVHETAVEAGEDCPVHASNTSWFIWSAFAVGLLIMAGGLYIIMPQPHAGREFRKADTSKMDPVERQIHDLLVANNGSVLQAEIVRATGLTKVKVTRILDRLETMNVLERRRRGMSNIVILK